MHAQRDRKVMIMMMIVSVSVYGCRQAVKDLCVVDVGRSCRDTTAARVRSFLGFFCVHMARCQTVSVGKI